MSKIDKALRVITALPGLLFLSFGLRWLLAPEGMAKELGMPLLDGMARSTQIGDLTAFFIALGASILLGVFTLNRTWLHAAALLIGGAAVARTLAWALQDAAFATEFIIVEAVVAVLVLVAAARLTKA
ncbi:MAG: DUF4345 family protein [Halieaceae bacterium]